MNHDRVAERVVIMGAAGRDFHNFNVALRDDPEVEVVAFTAAQIPGVAGRTYPPSLSGPRYPQGIPILAEEALEEVCTANGVTRVVFAYSDVSHHTVMHAAARALALGADFVLMGPAHTMLRAACPVIAVSAVRTGCGKSQTARHLSRLLRDRGLRASVIRHPMPYGDLAREAVQHFTSRDDLAAAQCTIEEREEYEPHLALGNAVFAGVDYAAIVAAAAKAGDVILWDGGNNDFPFVRPDFHVVLVDALRPGDETRYHPGEAVLRMADAIVIAKSDAADQATVAALDADLRARRPGIPVVKAASPVRLDDLAAVKERRVLVVEDGPTITHGGMSYGAGFVAATAAGAVPVDPRPFADPLIAEVYARYPHIGAVLPAMGYSPAQVESLKRTIEASDAEVVVAATPIDLAALIPLTKPVVRARYEYADAGAPTLGGLLDGFLVRQGLART